MREFHAIFPRLHRYEEIAPGSLEFRYEASDPMRQCHVGPHCSQPPATVNLPDPDNEPIMDAELPCGKADDFFA